MRTTRTIVGGWRRRLAALLASLAVAGCGGGGNSETPGTAPPASDSATIADGGGAVVHADGAGLTVPADALRAASTLRIAKNSTDAPALPDGALASDVYAITPHGTQFAHPATVRLPYDARQLPPGSQPVIAKADTPDGPWRLLDTVVNADGTVSAQVNSLSWFVVMPGPMAVIGSVDLTPRLSYRLSSSDGVGDWVVPAGADVTATKTVLRPASQYYELTLVNAPACVGGWRVSVETSRQYRNAANPAGSMVTDRITIENGGLYTSISNHVSADGVFRIEVPWSKLEQVNNMTEFEFFGANPSRRVVGDIFFQAFVDHPYCASSRTFFPSAAPAVRRLEISARTGARKISVSRHPASTTVGAGQPAVFSADIFNTGPALTDNRLRVDWLRAEPGSSLFVPLGSTFSVDTTGTVHSLRLAAATAADNGARYRAVACVIDNTSASSDCVETEAATLTVTQAVVVPAFTQMPASLLVRSGQTASFSAAATGTPAPTLQWQTRAPNGAGAWADVAGASGSTYTTPVLGLADNGRQVRVVATNAVGAAESTPVTVSVSDLDVAPTITTQPATIVVAAGGDAVFAVAARGTEALSYQWRFNGSRIAGANAAVLRLPAVTGAQAGLYSVVVSNAAGSATSADATLDVTAGAPAAVAPTIVTQPVSVLTHVGNTATFGVGVAGTGPLSYQWLKAGQPIVGATAATFSVASATLADDGSYAVRVSNAVGSVTSWNVVLTVNEAVQPQALAITTQPSPQVQLPGGSATFAVAASGSGPITYQWLKNGTPIAGATAAVLTLGGVTGSDAGSYAVTVSNPLGSVTSSAVALTVVGAPGITTQPTAQSVTTGGTASFSVTASGSGLRYQWTLNGVAIVGATASSYTTPATTLADNGGVYGVVVYNGTGIVFSQGAVLSVATAPVASPEGKIAAGLNHTCAIDRNGALYCWGNGGNGEIGDGAATFRAVPTRVSGLGTVKAVAAGSWDSCAIDNADALWCWGSMGDRVPAPLAAAAGVRVRAVSLGSDHGCYVDDASQVFCWGNTTFGKRGDLNPGDAPTPVRRADDSLLRDAVSVAVGVNHSCAQLADGSVWCWGADVAFGIHDLATRVMRRLPDGSRMDFTATGRVIAGRYHTCAIESSSGQPMCWGHNEQGQLGDGTTLSRDDAMPADIFGAVSLAAGAWHTCATRASDMYCWGYGFMGNGGEREQLLSPAVAGRVGAYFNSADPPRVAAAGERHTCALRSSGDLQCWGWNNAGQAGIGSWSDTVNVLVPTSTTLGAEFWRP